MATTTKVLARTAAATSSTTLYTVPSATTTVVTNIVICNPTASAVTASMTINAIDILGGVSIAGKEQVYLNGVLLVRTTDYTASDGTSITSLAALTAGDILEVITFTPFEVANVLSPTLFDAKGDILVATAADTAGKLTLGTNGYYLKVNTSTATGLEWAQVDLSAYATVATENDNTIMNIMGAY
jgi:hypothetical protein